MTVAGPEADDAEMRDLMAKWESETQVEDVSDDDAGSDDDEPMSYDQMLEKYRRNVTVTNNAFDHVVLGTSDLDRAVDDFEKLTGVRPLMVVSHNGCGTKSARVAFQQCAFLELLGPDPKQSSTLLATKLAKIPEGKFVPIHYAIRNTKSSDLKKSTWADMGYECDEVTMIAKEKGQPWKWSMYFLEGHDDDGLIPFFVDWGKASHAAAKLPIVGKLDKVVVRGPSDNKLHQLLKGVDDVDVQSGDEFFECTFTSSKGKHTFSSSNLIGITFPK